MWLDMYEQFSDLTKDEQICSAKNLSHPGLLISLIQQTVALVE